MTKRYDYKHYKIYVIVDKRDDRVVYVGETKVKYPTTLRTRYHKVAFNRRGKNYYRPIYKYIRDAGKENIEVRIIDSTDDKGESKRLEQHYIDHYDTYNNGCNMTKDGQPGGVVGISRKHTETTKRKISRSVKKLGPNQNALDAMKNANRKSCVVKGIRFNSRNDAAEYFGVHVNTIYKWLKKC